MIAVIVLIVISAVLVVLVLCVAKKNNLCCFRYKQVPVKENPDKPCDKHGPLTPPIVKNGVNGNGEKGSNEPQVWSLSSLKVSRQLSTNDLNQVSSVSLLMTSSTALTNEGLFELTRRTFDDTGRLVFIRRNF